MGHQGGERLGLAAYQGQRPGRVPGVAHPDALHAHPSPRHRFKGGKRHRPRRRAEPYQRHRPARAHQVQRFLGRRDAAGGLDHHVRPAAMGEVVHLLQAPGGIRGVPVDGHRGAQPQAVVKARAGAADDHHLRRATLARHGGGERPQGAGAQDHGHVAHPHRAEVESVRCGGAGAGGGHQRRRVLVVNDGKEGRAGIQDDVRGVAAVQVRRRGARAMDAIGPAVRAEGGLPQHGAVVALAATDAPLPQDARPRREAIAIHVAPFAGHLHHPPDPLVSEDDG